MSSFAAAVAAIAAAAVVILSRHSRVAILALQNSPSRPTVGM